ncbi:MAG: UDP-N-acetylmuramoyl-L-alanyl-D-glutamate--2,6-diaminopimelate ligase [Alphaproteobacteria bacterium MarineAlpha5_Bin10]|nr:MAG: UDP-N-acetylmuramoyl-L-alanyl-D-glutamate--2,6-diaminopimelate ligase [Alphaproteobacteria bacterium MarineAlpha5_Bin10]
MQLFDFLTKINITTKFEYKFNKKIKNITQNSKEIKKGDIFISLKSKKIKSTKFIMEAINKGCIAIISDKKIPKINTKIPIIYNKELKKNLHFFLKNLYKKTPHNIIAITGTNGKTSVCWYLYQILKLNNSNVSYIGTIGEYYNNLKISNTSLTTPDICSLYRLADLHAKKGSRNFIFEASSHGISQKRIFGFPLTIAAITNITKDHLDYHKSLAEYRKVKLSLFTDYLNNNGLAIVNSTINLKRNFISKLKSKKIKLLSYGSLKDKIYIQFKKGAYFIKIYNERFILPIDFAYDFDLRNLECAIAIALHLGLSIENTFNSIANIARPPGRMQLCYPLHNRSKVYIDYAHTPDALKNILISVRKLQNIKPSVVFGCGGDRDKSKRILMGKIANRNANKVYITDDNPRSEKSANILLSIAKGCSRAILINKRENAIRKAVQDLKENEILIIAGRGHEKFQLIKNKKIPFDDLKITNSIIKKINNDQRKK